MTTSGTSNLFFSKQTKVYLEQNTTGGTSGGTMNLWELPILAGFSFTQSPKTSEVTLNEMSSAAGNSRRGKRVFTDAFDPAEWSFSTYARPTLASVKVRSPEEALWANFVAPNAYAAGAWVAGTVDFSGAATQTDITFVGSNKTTLGTFNLYIVLGASTATSANYTDLADTTIYKINNCTINEVTMSFDIDGIATLAWSGMGTTVQELASFDASAAITVGVTSSTNLIRNRVTQMALVSDATMPGGSKTYAITLTGGSITISNNITYLTPEVMGKVNQPLGHVTGTRSVSGSFTAYLDEATLGSIDLFSDISGWTSTITNSFAVDLYVGGKQAAADLPGNTTSSSPGIQFKMPTVHLAIPKLDMADVVSVNVDFTALPSTISGTDEISKITYVGF